MKSYIVVEGAFDAALLGSVLGALLPGRDIVVVGGGGRSSAISLARTLLVSRHLPVILALDADTVDPRAIREQRHDLESLLEMAGEPNLWKVVLFEPVIEGVLLFDLQFAEALFETKLTSEQKALIQYDPKRILKELSRQQRLSSQEGSLLIQRISDLDLTPLAKDPAIREIVEFLSASNQRSAA